MQNEPQTYISSPQVFEFQPKDYSEVLNFYNLNYSISGEYLSVGTKNSTVKWILNISVIVSHLLPALHIIIPFLIEKDIPFDIALNTKIARRILEGIYGQTKLGKVIIIYPNNDASAVEIAKQLILLTKQFKGPQILNGFNLGSVVYCQMADQQHQMMTIPIADWPFSSICPQLSLRPQTVYHDKYKLFSILKGDFKGNVYKGLFLRSFIFAKWCVVKEGKKNMLSDLAGRDACDRLRWQQQILSDLQNKIPLPKVYGFYNNEFSSHLVLEYISGNSLDKKIVSIYKSRPWWQLNDRERDLLLDLSIQMIEIVDKLHELKYIHRDINPGNFMVTKKNKLMLLDVELAYSEKTLYPSPVFQLGTKGFMSKEQQDSLTPTTAEDVYAIGASLIALFTGLQPGTFDSSSKTNLQHHLLLFINNIDLIEIITDCLRKEPSSRPSLAVVNSKIKSVRNVVMARRTTGMSL